MAYERQNKLPILIFPITTEVITSTVALLDIMSNIIGYCITGEFTYGMIDSYY